MNGQPRASTDRSPRGGPSGRAMDHGLVPDVLAAGQSHQRLSTSHCGFELRKRGLQDVFNPKGAFTVGLMDERSRKNTKKRLTREARPEVRGLLRRITAGLARLKSTENPKTERKLTLSEVEDLLKTEDDGTIEQRETVDAALTELVFTELTVRQRAILMAVLSGEGSRRTIAKRFGTSASRLDGELGQALELASEIIQRLLRERGPRLR